VEVSADHLLGIQRVEASQRDFAPPSLGATTLVLGVSKALGAVLLQPVAPPTPRNPAILTHCRAVVQRLCRREGGGERERERERERARESERDS